MIKSTEIGRPVTLGKEDSPSVTYHRIIEHITGAASIDNIVAKVRISTPGGSIIETGIAYLYDMNKEGFTKLKEFEDYTRSKDIPLYAGKLSIE